MRILEIQHSSIGHSNCGLHNYLEGQKVTLFVKPKEETNCVITKW